MANRASETDLSEFDAGGDRKDELFDVLSDQRRRVLLYSLQTSQMPVSVGELATKLATWEATRSLSDRSSDDRTTVETSLVHTHLPKMAEAELIEYDETERRVTLANRTDELRAHLRTMTSS
jgi:predicted transcriptional regulator